MATSRQDDANSETLLVPQLADHDGQEGAVVAACERYFRAVAARDIDGVLAVMTARHGKQLRQMRQWLDFCAFFQLWCEAQGRLRRVIMSQAECGFGAALLDVEHDVVRLSLRCVEGHWLIDSEQSERRR